MGIHRGPCGIRAKRDLRGLQVESPCLTDGDFCSPANSEWQGNKAACGRCTALELRRKPFGALSWSRLGSASHRKGSSQRRGQRHPEFLLHHFPGIESFQNSSPLCWACVGSYTIELDFVLLKELGATSHEVNMGFLGLRLSRYQHKSSPKVKAVILPMAFSPTCPPKEACRTSWSVSPGTCGCSVR